MEEEKIHNAIETFGWIMFIVVLIHLLTSCGVCKNCKYQTTDRDSIYVERVDSVFVTDTILLYQPQDSTTSNVVEDTEKSHLETDLATSDAWVDNGKLHHSLSNKKDLIPISVKIPNYISREVKHHFQVVTKMVERDFKWWEEAFMYMGKVMLFIIICFFIFKSVKLWLKK